MKILLVAPPSLFWDQVQTALSRFVEVARFDTRRFVLAGGLAEKTMWRALKVIPALKHLNTNRIGSELIRAAYGCDAVLLYKFGDVPIEAMEFIRKSGMKLSAWQIDPPNEDDVSRAWAAYTSIVDVVFHFDGAMATAEQPCRIVHLPLAVDAGRFALARELADLRRYDTDISFIGAPYPERVRLLSRIADRGLALYGWEGWKSTPLAKHYRGPVTVDEAAYIYARSKISVNINWTPPIAGVNLKTFEIPMAGGTQLTDVREDLPVLFTPDEEVAVYRNDHEFERQIERLLSDDAYRERIRVAGVTRALRDHTLERRVEIIVSTLKSLR